MQIAIKTNASEITGVNITNGIAGDANETLGEIVAKHPGKAAILKKYGLDFCCGGKKTLRQACIEKGIDISIIEQELEKANKNSASRHLLYDDWSLDFLVDFIVNTHHSYVKSTLPGLRQYATKVAAVHGDHHPELLRILHLVEKVNAELLSHMQKEEKILFPYIKELTHRVNGSGPLYAPFGTVQNPISMMEIEHEQVGKWLEEIRMISDNFTPPDDACTSYRLLYTLLEEFEEDLHMHIHLENNILFLKAMKLEENSES